MCHSFDSHLLNYCCKTKHLSTQLSPISSTQQDSSKYLIFADKTLLKCLSTMELNMVVLEVNLWKKSAPLNQNDGVTNIQFKWQMDKNVWFQWKLKSQPLFWEIQWLMLTFNWPTYAEPAQSFEERCFLVISYCGGVQNLPELNQPQVMISRQLSECQGQGSVISCYLYPAHIGGLCSSGNGATWEPRQVEPYFTRYYLRQSKHV